MRSDRLPLWGRALLAAGTALVFLLAFEWLVYRVPVTEIYLPAGFWSDEVIYSKQLSATVACGGPQGYFGFNESHAQVGTYAAWGPAVFWMYALPGFFLRGQNAFLWCNMLFMAVGWAVLVCAAHLNWKQQAAFAVMLAAMKLPLRYVFSAMQEPFHYALVLALLGCGILVRRKGSRAAWAVLCVLCAAATLVRPYEAVFWLYPLVLGWRSRRKVVLCAAGGAVSLGGTMLLMSKCYAPYFFTNVDTGPLQELAHGQVISAARSVAHKLLDTLAQLGQEIARGVQERSGGEYLVFFLLLAVTVICLIVDRRRGRPTLWKGCALAASVIIFLALLLMYRLVESARHTLVLDILLMASLVVEDLPAAAGTAAATALLAAVSIVNMAAASYGLPRYDADLAAEVETVQTVLQESQAALDSQEEQDPWDHALAYAFGDAAPCGLLYAVPDGMGIEFDEAGYLSDESHEIYSRYVMTAQSSATEQRLTAEGWQPLYLSDRCAVYERPAAKEGS